MAVKLLENESWFSTLYVRGFVFSTRHSMINRTSFHLQQFTITVVSLFGMSLQALNTKRRLSPTVCNASPHIDV